MAKSPFLESANDSHVIDDPIIDSLITDNPWRKLRHFTDARIGLGRVGNSIPTDGLLKFQLAHAQAMDAVHTPLDISSLCDELCAYIPDPDALILHSQAADRMVYLQRPDLGRQLDDASCQTLSEYQRNNCTQADLAIVIADGLSARAVQEHAVAVIAALAERLTSDPSQSWIFAPITVVQQGRVAIGDDVGELLNVKAVIVLIGERPGLSSPDSLGMYLTWQPKRGLDDSRRNCISNVRPQGLSYAEASRRAFYLLTESRRLSLSGVDLKDRSDTDSLNAGSLDTNGLDANSAEERQETPNFLLS